MSSSTHTTSKSHLTTPSGDELALPTPRPLSAIVKPHLSRMLNILSYTPPIYLLARVLAFLAPPTDRASKSNDLHFRFAYPSSSLRAGRYEVGITAGVIPKRFHAHNDYQHKYPLLQALSYGAASIEADVHLVNGTLLVGHDPSDLSPEKTLNALYLDPLHKLLDAANKDNEGRMKGVWETAPYMPLHLLIDIKTEGAAAFNALHQALKPLRQSGYLTTWSSSPSTTSSSPISPPYELDNGTLHPAPLSIIGTGNTPLSSVLSLDGSGQTPRDIFLDGQLLSLLPLPNPYAYPELPQGLTPSIAPICSVDLRLAVGWTAWTVPSLAAPRVRQLVELAHEKGIQARFWRIANPSEAVRNSIWGMLMSEGVDWLNVDDLAGAAGY